LIVCLQWRNRWTPARCMYVCMYMSGRSHELLVCICVCVRMHCLRVCNEPMHDLFICLYVRRVYLCVCIYTHTHTCIHIRILSLPLGVLHTCTHTNKHKHTHTHTRTHTHAYLTLPVGVSPRAHLLLHVINALQARLRLT
jgi:hypothetical protein